MSYENKILQMKKMLGKKKESKDEKQAFIKPDQPFYTKEWQKAGLTLVENDFGVLFKRRVSYPLNYKHGIYELGLFSRAIEKWESLNTDHPYSINFDEGIVFFDTETTGLKGVGTQIFLIGLLELEEDEFVLTQYVLADPSNEVAFLFESKFWQQTKTIITYNGKSFDWPQLETRFTLHRNVLPKLKSHRQIDLLHSTKRIWKNNLEKMKLTSVEEEKLGFKRQGDIPGFLAPIIYSDAVKSGNAQTLMKVLYHNEWDLLSLITLYIHSTNLLLDEDSLIDSATTHTNIGKWYSDLKQQQKSEEVLRNVTQEYNEDDTGRAYYYLAFQEKRNGQFLEAANSFQKAIDSVGYYEKMKAYEQLAMLNEHQFKNYYNALQYTLKGIELIEKSQLLNDEQKKKQNVLWNKRLSRIENKLKKL